MASEVQHSVRNSRFAVCHWRHYHLVAHHHLSSGTASVFTTCLQEQANREADAARSAALKDPFAPPPPPPRLEVCKNKQLHLQNKLSNLLLLHSHHTAVGTMHCTPPHLVIVC